MAPNGNSNPYRSTYNIEDLFNGAGHHEDAITVLDENVDAKIMGYDHHFSGQHKGKENLLKNVFRDLSSMVNTEKGTEYEVVNVIGGGVSPWAAIEGKATGRSKSGKKFEHEHAYIVKFNKQGKVTKLRAYYDTHHIHGHARDHGLAP